MGLKVETIIFVQKEPELVNLKSLQTCKTLEEIQIFTANR